MRLHGNMSAVYISIGSILLIMTSLTPDIDYICFVHDISTSIGYQLAGHDIFLCRSLTRGKQLRTRSLLAMSFCFHMIDVHVSASTQIIKSILFEIEVFMEL